MVISDRKHNAWDRDRDENNTPPPLPRVMVLQRCITRADQEEGRLQSSELKSARLQAIFPAHCDTA